MVRSAAFASKLAPTVSAHQTTKPQGRALARLALLILLLLLLLIHPPLRKAEWRHPSGEWARSAVRRSRTHREEVQRSKPEAMSPEGCRSERTPSPSEGPDARGETFWFLLGRLPKGTRPSGRNHKQPLPQQWICTPKTTWSAIRPPSLASQLPQESRASAGIRLTATPPSRAGSLPQGS